MGSAMMESAPGADSATIAGGFVLVPAASMMAAWRACRRPGLGVGAFRAWLALRAKAARAELVGLGWMRPEPSDPWAERRWGRAFRIDLAWQAPGRRSSPVAPAAGPRSSPPDLTGISLREGEIHQDPAPGGRAGVGLEGAGDGGKRPGHLAANPPGAEAEVGRPAPIPAPGPGPRPTPPPAGPAARPSTGPLHAPKLDDVRAEDLRDVGRALALFDQAVARGLVGPGEDGRLRFLAAAEHARAVGTANPPGLFARLVRGGLWGHASQADEDAAARQLREHLHGRRPRVGPFMPDRPAAAPRSLAAVLARMMGEATAEG